LCPRRESPPQGNVARPSSDSPAVGQRSARKAASAATRRSPAAAYPHSFSGIRPNARGLSSSPSLERHARTSTPTVGVQWELWLGISARPGARRPVLLLCSCARRPRTSAHSSRRFGDFYSIRLKLLFNKIKHFSDRFLPVVSTRQSSRQFPLHPYTCADQAEVDRRADDHDASCLSATTGPAIPIAPLQS
jgi:hypothetical protein